jgi:hypothetical protein
MQQQNLAAQKVVDIRIIKGRRQEDIDVEAAMRLKIRALALKEYKKFIDDAKAGLEAARKPFADDVTINALTRESTFTINEWIHIDKIRGGSASGSKVTKTFITQFRNEYDTPTQCAQRAICERLGFEYDKTKGAHRPLVPEVSIERQMLAMMAEGWSPKDGTSISSSNSDNMFFQTMVKYEVTAPAPAAPEESQTLGVRRKTGAI